MAYTSLSPRNARPGTIGRRLVVALSVLAFAVFAVVPAVHTEAQEPEAETRAPAYRITSVEYQIEGRTREWILQDLLDLHEGLTFQDELELLEHIQRQQQILINQRALQNAAVWAEYDETGDDRPTSVAVTVQVKDTWNIIVLPYAKYDSNTGLLLSLRGRDYNFFGTLTELEVNFDYERTDENTDLFTISGNFSVPFNLLERRWKLIAEQNLEMEGDEFELELALGVGYDFDLAGLGWEAVYKQTYRYITDDEFSDNSFNTSRLSMGTSLELPVEVPAFGDLSYNPEAYAETSYRPGGISEERRGVAVGFDQAFEAGGFDWVGNYRRGAALTVGNDNRYNINKAEWDTEINAQVAAYQSFFQRDASTWPKAGVSGSLSGFYLIDGADEDQDDAADAARGILNDTMNGDLGLFTNLDAVVTVWTLEPIFEAQFGVFFDVALVRDTRGTFYESTAFNAERDLRYGGGIEVIGFPLFARSLYVRGSLGFDLRSVAEGEDPLDGDVREIFIGLGHHY